MTLDGQPSSAPKMEDSWLDLIAALGTTICVVWYLPYAAYLNNRLECLADPPSFALSRVFMSAAIVFSVFVGFRVLRRVVGGPIADRFVIFAVGCCAALYLSTLFAVNGSGWQTTGASCVDPFATFRPVMLAWLAIPVATLFLSFSRRVALWSTGALVLLLCVGIAEATVAHQSFSARDLGTAIKPGTEIRFTYASDADKYLRGDVLRPESVGTWVGREVAINVPIAKPVSSDLRLTLQMLGIENQVSTIKINGRAQAVFDAKRAQAPVLVVQPSQLDPNGVLHIRIDSKSISRPANGDTRQRSIFLQSLRIDPA